MTGGLALKWAGLIIMSYTLTAIAGNYLMSVLASRIGLRRVIAVACVSGAVLQGLLIFGKEVPTFMIIRMCQTGVIAAVFPLTLSLFARNAGGAMMGFLNSSRLIGFAIGPIMATSVMVSSGLLTLYIIIAGMTLVSLWAFLISFQDSRNL